MRPRARSYAALAREHSYSDLEHPLLQVQVVLHILINSLANHFGSLLAVLLLPFSIPLFFGLGGFLLDSISTLREEEVSKERDNSRAF